MVEEGGGVNDPSFLPSFFPSFLPPFLPYNLSFHPFFFFLSIPFQFKNNFQKPPFLFQYAESSLLSEPESGKTSSTAGQ